MSKANPQELVFSICNVFSNVTNILQDQRGWWFSRENDYFKADDATDCDKGFESSLGMIERTFQLHGPFDGIFAFSQGAALASLMCLMKERKEVLLM